MQQGTDVCPPSSPVSSSLIGGAGGGEGVMEYIGASSSSSSSRPAPRPPATPEERLRIQEKYREKIKERKIRIYQTALDEVIRREKAGAMLTLLFKVTYNTHFGQNVFLVGSEAGLLGGWNPDGAVSLQWTEGNVWVGEVKIPRGVTTLEYKYILKEGSYVVWEPGRNHVVDLRRLAAGKEGGAKRRENSLGRKAGAGGGGGGGAAGAGGAHVIQDVWGAG